MTNPYQHASGAFRGDHPSMPTGLPGFSQRRTPYASVASGATAFPRVGSFAHLLNPTNDGADGHSYSARNRNGEGARNGAEENGTTGRPPGQRNPPLPPSSRAWEPFLGNGSINFETLGPQGSNGGFFTPSYLRDSTYAQRLESQHKARLLVQREGHGIVSQGGGLRTSGSSLSLHGSKMTTPSHRSVTFERTEKAPACDGDDTITPLPSRWNRGDKSSSLDVLFGGLEVRYTTSRGSTERDHEAWAVRADHFIPPQCGIYYYEVTILARKRDDTTIGIGFCDRSVMLSRPLGWEPNSFGYHGDDGHVYHSHNVGRPYGPVFTAGDVVGCGVNFRTGCAFFTKNGYYLDTAFREIKGPNLELFPTVGLKKTGEHIRVNFGQAPFVFDIDGLMKEERAIVGRQISATSTAHLEPPLEETELIQRLVLQFLQHDGYVETARAFAEEIQGQKKALNLTPAGKVEGSNITEDDDASNRQRFAEDKDANNRQQIRRAVLEGDIDLALELTDQYYPDVLDENEQVQFKLRCRKFVEMVRREAELNMTGGDRRSNGQQDMEIDDMDVEDGDGAENHGRANEALLYGQTLAAEYRDDTRDDVRKSLADIFSLMAYTNPLKEKEVRHLLDRNGRAAVAEELNSAILQSLGKSSRSGLENLYAQTKVLLEEIRSEGGAGAFVTIQHDIIAQIPTSNVF